MAIYDLGTASLAANGEVTGVGTAWKAPLTLIRVGATIIFKTNPLKIYTISEIISDTQINVYNPNSETVPAGTGYAILAHDGITVQGLAQDVAETLRYYQSKETSIQSLLDFIGQDSFDWPRFEQLANQSVTGAAEALASQIAAAESAATAVSARNITTAARDATIAAIDSAGDAGTMVALAGMGISGTTPLLTSLDWDTFNFNSGSRYLCRVSSMTNAPEVITSTFPSSAVCIIEVKSNRGINGQKNFQISANTSSDNLYRVIDLNQIVTGGVRSYVSREALYVASGSNAGGASAERVRGLLDVYSKNETFEKSLNFSDVTNKSAARTNLGVYSKSEINSREGYSTNLAEVTSGLSKGMATISESLVIADGLSVPSFAEISGDKNFRAGFIGVDYRKNKTIRKSSNSTVTLSNQDSNAGSQVVDAVLYQDPAWPFLSVYPQKTTIKNLTIEGNSAASKNQAAIYILQAGVAEIDGVDTINCKYSVWSKDIFQTRINRVFSNDGKIRLDNGTSVVLSNCGLASSDTERTGAFDLTGMKYSTMISCTSDHTTNTAYSLNACEGLSMISCGCEASGTTTPNSGTAIAFRDNNRNIFVSGFSCLPVPDQGPALVSFGSNNDINLTNFEVIPGINYSSDFYIAGPGNNIVINGGRFGRSGGLMPVVTASGSAIGSRITYNASNGVTYDYVVAAAGVVNPVPRKSAITSILVNAEGNVIRGSGASCVREANGTYLVTLDYSNGITGASVDLYGYIGLSSFVFVDNNKIRVSVTNTGGVAVNQAFSVIVF